MPSELNETDWPQALAKESRFDYVVAADVLEHVYDPWATLRSMNIDDCRGHPLTLANRSG